MFFVHRFIPVSLFDNTAISMAASGSEAFCNGCPHVWEADGWFAFIKTCVFLMDTWLANRWSLGPIWDSHPPPNRCFIEKAAPPSLSACTLPYTLSLFTLHRSSFNCFFGAMQHFGGQRSDWMQLLFDAFGCPAAEGRSLTISFNTPIAWRDSEADARCVVWSLHGWGASFHLRRSLLETLCGDLSLKAVADIFFLDWPRLSHAAHTPVDSFSHLVLTLRVASQKQHVICWQTL